MHVHCLSIQRFVFVCVHNAWLIAFSFWEKCLYSTLGHHKTHQHIHKELFKLRLGPHTSVGSAIQKGLGVSVLVTHIDMCPGSFTGDETGTGLISCILHCSSSSLLNLPQTKDHSGEKERIHKAAKTEMTTRIVSSLMKWSHKLKTLKEYRDFRRSPQELDIYFQTSQSDSLAEVCDGMLYARFDWLHSILTISPWSHWDVVVSFVDGTVTESGCCCLCAGFREKKRSAACGSKMKGRRSWNSS